MGFVIPTSVVSNQKEEEDIHLIGEDLYNMFLGVAIITTCLLVAIVAGMFACFFAHFFLTSHKVVYTREKNLCFQSLEAYLRYV